MAAPYTPASWQTRGLLALRHQDSRTVHQEQIKEILIAQGLPSEGIHQVLKAFAQAPVRAMQGHGGSVRVDFESRKMQRTFRCESRTVEFAMAMELERDPDVLAYCLQPMVLDLKIGSGVGTTRIQHTPDALVVTADAVYLDEWKPSERYERLAKTHPKRYSVIDDVLTCPAAVQKTASWGLTYRVRHPGHLPAIFLENLNYLEDYADGPPLEDEARQRIQAAVQRQPVGTLATLLEAVPQLTIDHLLRALMEGVIVADLRRDRLCQQATAFVYRDELTMEIAVLEREAQVTRHIGRLDFELVEGMTFLLDGQRFEVVAIGELEVILARDDGKQLSLKQATLDRAHAAGQLQVESVPASATHPSELSALLLVTSREDLADASRKLDVVQGRVPAEGISERTLRDWKARVSAAQARGEAPLVGLLPRRATQGNHSSRIDPRNLALIEQILDEKYFQVERPSKTSAYKFYSAACLAKGIEPVSRQTFGDHAKRLSNDSRNFRRFGKRLANAMKPTYVAAAYETSVHGVRPFEVVHIDHTQADIELASEIDGQPLGRPWASVALDAHSRNVLAHNLSYQAPNSSTVLGVLREIVKRHGRLPAILVLDNGPDFRSKDLAAFCRAFGITVRWRPPGMPRFGSVGERVFGTINTEFLHRLRGNTEIMKQVRTVTGSALPERVTRWHLRHLHVAFQFYLYEIYNCNVHPALGDLSPAKALLQGLQRHGLRHHKRVRFDEHLHILTCPLVERETRKLNRRTGVKVREQYYHAPELMEPRLDGQVVQVRQDPQNVDVVYVQVDKRWIKAVRSGNLEARSLNVWELKIYTEELVARKILSAEQAKDIGRVQREAALCNLIQQLEREAHQQFRRLKEEGLITAGLAATAGAGRSEPSDALASSVAPSTVQTVSEMKGLPETSGELIGSFEDYAGGF